MKILSFPFRFNPSQPSSFSVYEQGGDDYKAQQIEAFMRTSKGEHPIFKDFGINDPTFGGSRAAGFDDTTFVSEFATFYDDIVLTKVNLVSSEGALQKIQIEFT